jgi:transcriptional regulator with XRE-family HTH domain
MPTPHYPPPAVLRALRALGEDLREARLRRRLTMRIIAERAFTSRATLQRIEQGDPGVGMGIYAAVLQALGLLEGLNQLADMAHDPVGQALASAQLPKRARMPRVSGVADEHDAH